MELGGVLLGAGMVLTFVEGDYLYGNGPVQLTLERIVETRIEWDVAWVVLTGREKTSLGVWRDRRLQARVSALKKALSTPTAA